MQSTTRGRSFTNFPRNTRQQHLRTCAAEARKAEQEAEQQKLVAAEMEACYAEYQPTQVFHQDKMAPAIITGRYIGSCADLLKDRS